LELLPNQPKIIVARGYSHMRAGHDQLALQDFELALALDSALVDAYAGRAEALVAAQRFDQALIALTKAIHRFKGTDLAAILVARAKIFARMGRFNAAVNDFTCAVDLLRDVPEAVVEIRLARAAAYCQLGMFDRASEDLTRISKIQPENEDLHQALLYTKSGGQLGVTPKMLSATANVVRPLRPAIAREPIEPVDVPRDLHAPAPYDSFIVCTGEDKEYGPVSAQTLLVWIGEGRLATGMQIMRCDWSEWKPAETVFPQLAAAIEIDRFPQLRVRGRRKSDQQKQVDHDQFELETKSAPAVDSAPQVVETSAPKPPQAAD
jgi:tetratricopeptide (TPR) repeat protein